MNGKKVLSTLGIILGLFMILSTILFLKDDSLNRISGVIIGVGSGILGVSFGTILTMFLDKKNPNRERVREIEIKDERNLLIREKVALRTNSFMTYAISAVILLFVILGASNFVVFTMVALLIIKQIISFAYYNYFSKAL